MKIITSNTSRGAYLGVVKELKSKLSDTALNIVIAPDRFTASVERGLISTLGIESTFGIEVMSFTRLASKLLGNEIKKCLTPEGSVMLIGKVISDLQGELDYYGKVAMKEGFASELYAGLTALRNSGVSSQKLLEVSQKATSSIKAKTKDLAKIYSGYLQALEGKHSDSTTRLYSLVELIKNNPSLVAGINFYCTDIYEFTAPQLDILRELARSALSLTIGIASGYDNPNRRIYPGTVLKTLCKLSDSNAQIERNDEVLDDAIGAISQKLFAYVSTDGKDKAECNGKVKLRCAKDRYDEVMSLAMDVQRHVLEGGRYKDFEVFASDIEAYESEIKATFSRYNIPYFIDKKEMLADQTKVRFVLEAIAMVRSGYRRREVLDFVKNPIFTLLCPSGEDGVYLFENYCLKYNYQYIPMTSEKAFSRCDEKPFHGANEHKKHLIYAKNNDKVLVLDNFKENEIPEQVRATLVDLLKPLFGAKKRNIKEFVKSIKQLLESVAVYSDSYVEKLTALDAYYFKCAEQVDSKLNAVLDEIFEVLDYQTDIQGFESVFKSMIKTLKIALVPTYLDCVIVGDIDSRFSGNGSIYILGANNTKLPPQSGGGVVITQKDEDMLATLGIELVTNERQKLATNMYAVCDVMCKPKDKLVISYPESGDGTALRASTIIAELQGMLVENGKPIEVERVSYDSYATIDGEELADMQKASVAFSTEKGRYNEVLRNVASGRAVARDMHTFGSAFAMLSDEDKKRLGSDQLPERINLPDNAYFAGRTSVSRLETFFGCPYAHYFNYVLSLRRRKDGSFEGTENGTILHHVLECFFKDVRDGKIDDDTPLDEKAYEYFDSAIKENNFGILLEKSDTQRLLLRVREEGVKLCKDMYEIQKRATFRPCLLEAKIGEGEIKPMSLIFEDKEIELKGTVDRIDRLDDKFFIIDYKTYKSADLSLKELYSGQKLQLYIYMRAVEQSLNAEPCGVFYFPIFSSFVKEDEDIRYKYKGQASNSVEVLTQMDSLISSSPKEAIVPYKTKSGVLSSDIHLSRKDFDTLGDYAVRLATSGAKLISEGYIKPSPISEKCRMCDFQGICAYKGCVDRKVPKVKGLQSFDLNATQEEEDDNE